MAIHLQLFVQIEGNGQYTNHGKSLRLLKVAFRPGGLTPRLPESIYFLKKSFSPFGERKRKKSKKLKTNMS